MSRTLNIALSMILYLLFMFLDAIDFGGLIAIVGSIYFGKKYSLRALLFLGILTAIDRGILILIYGVPFARTMANMLIAIDPAFGVPTLQNVLIIVGMAYWALISLYVAYFFDRLLNRYISQFSLKK